MNRRCLCRLITTILVGPGILLSSSVGVANPSAGSEATVKPAGPLDPRQAAILTSAGTRVLVHLAEARGAIQERDANRARQDLRNAEKLLNVIRSTNPSSIVKDRIWIARRHLEYEGTQQVLPDLVPIEQELALLREWLPTREAISHLERARGLLESGDKQAGLDELKAVDCAVLYEELDLPVSETEAHVSRALSELAVGETEKADSALQAAENSVESIVATARGPLTKDSSNADTVANEQTEER